MIKKFFALAAIFAATMMSFTSCEDTTKPDGGKEVETDDGPAQGAAQAWDPTFYHYTDSGTEKVLDSGMAVLSSVPAAYKGATWAFEASILRSVVLEAYSNSSVISTVSEIYKGGLRVAIFYVPKKLLTKISRKLLKIKIIVVYLQPAKMCCGV